MDRSVCLAQVVNSRKLVVLIVVVMLGAFTSANPPVIDFSHNMRILKLPNNTKVGSIIYRLKGTDADNDIIEFGARGPTGRLLLDFKNVSFYESDVYLKSPLEKNEYKITIFASDGQQFTEVETHIIVTESQLISESPFIPSENIIKIPESTNTNETIAMISVRERENSNLAVTFDLRGSDKFAIKYVFGPGGTSNAEIYLVEKVDYEKQNLFILTIIALNAWTNETLDTRNIAVIDKVIAIVDIQDKPPVFHDLPNVVLISENTKVGTIVLTLSAEDGDYGNQRNVTFDMDPKSNLHSYFGIDEIKGSVVLRRPVHDIKDDFGVKEPLILNVRAIEVVKPDDPIPGLSTNANIGLVIVSNDNKRPQFKSEHLFGSIAENSQIMTPVRWEGRSIPQVNDNDPGLNGTMILDIIDPFDTFMIQPKRGINEIIFSIVVKNNSKLDYESNSDKQFVIKVSAKDLSNYNSLNSTIFCTINLIDLNDNIPQFSQKVYEALIPEDAPTGTTVAKIEATDMDTGDYGTVRFTSINGPLSEDLRIDSETGVIVLKDNQNIDREMISEYRVTIEARDESGRGNKNVTELHIKIMDINDNAPVFLQPRYDAILNPDRFSFTQPLIVKALDADEPDSLNSKVGYEIISNNYQNKFSINENSGEITLNSALKDERNFKIANNLNNEYQNFKFLPELILTVRAHDHGIPYQNSTVPVYIHNPDFLNRTIIFTIEDSESNVRKRQELIKSGLSSMSGANVQISSIRPHRDKDKTEVLTWAAYPSQSSVDLSKTPLMLSQIIGKEYSSEKSEELKTSTLIAGNDLHLLFWLLIILILATLIFLIVFLFCWFCCCRDRIRRREKLKDSEETNYFKTGVNTSVVSEKSSKDKKHKKQKSDKKRANGSVQAWNEDTEDERLRSSFRPSSAPNNEPNHYNRNIRANSSQSFQDHYLANNPSLYQRVNINKLNRHQRTRVGPQYYDNFDANDIHSSLSDYRNAYHSVRSQNPQIRGVKGVDNMGYLRTTTEPYIIDELNEHSLQRTRPSVHHLPYNEKLITVPKRTEILYIQSPVIGPQEEVLRSISQNDIPYSDEEFDRYLVLSQSQSQSHNPSENIRESERIKFNSKPKQRHIYYNDHNLSDMTIPEEVTVPGMVPKDVPQSEQLIDIPSVSGSQSINYINNDKQRHSLNGDHNREEITSSDSRRESMTQMNGENDIKSENRVQSSGDLNERVNYSPNYDESIQITSVSGVPVSIELKDGVNKAMNKPINESIITNSDKRNAKNKRVLTKDNSFENSEKSYDSDSGIGRSAMNPKIGFDMKNSGLMEKKSIFTIAYNDVKTRHLQSAESNAE